MRPRFLRLGLFLLCAASPAFAQFDTVTGQVVDPNGLPYSGATVRAVLTLAGTNVTGQPTVTNSNQAQCISAGLGNAPCQMPFPGTQSFTLDPNGNIPGGGYQLASNALITPAGTQWTFNVTISPGVPPPFGFGPQNFAVPITISTNPQAIGAILSGAAPALTHTTGAGTATPCTLTNDTLQYNNSGAFGCVQQSAVDPTTQQLTSLTIGGSVGGVTALTVEPPVPVTIPVEFLNVDGLATAPLSIGVAFVGNVSGAVTNPSGIYALTQENLSDAFSAGATYGSMIGNRIIANIGLAAGNVTNLVGQDIEISNGTSGQQTNTTGVNVTFEGTANATTDYGVRVNPATAGTGATLWGFYADNTLSFLGGGVELGNVTGSTQCLNANSVGLVTGTGSSCGGFSSLHATTLSSNVTVGTTATTITSLSVTFPSTGCPCRADIRYSLYYDGDSFTDETAAAVWVSDGTNTMAGLQTGDSNAVSGGRTSMSLAGFSTVTYANNAVVTFTLLGQYANASSFNIDAAPTVGAGPNSTFQIMVIQCGSSC
jgi:hypothetical protein